MKTYDLPPHAPTLIESTRAIGYSLETALADIIDNSIAAQAEHVKLFFLPDNEDSNIAILDDGNGMDEDEITSAMQYGSRSPLEQRGDTDLGRFGLGLKTASLSQCRVLTVVSKQGARVAARKWDLDHVNATGAWSLLLLENQDFGAVPCIDELMKLEHGTLVVWEKLDRLTGNPVLSSGEMASRMDDVREHLGLVFHRYLAPESGTRKLSIDMNGREVQARDPFLRLKSFRPMDDEILTIRGAAVRVRPYILPHISQMTKADIEMLGGSESLRLHQGFYIYRNERLLSWGSWVRMLPKKEMSKLARIQVDIPNVLDDLWGLDIKKSEAVPPREIRGSLRSIIRRISDQSAQVFRHRARMETKGDAIQAWERGKTRSGGWIYLINRSYPLVRILREASPETAGRLEQLLVQLESELPINSIYNDFIGDETVETRAHDGLIELLPVVRNVLEGLSGRQRDDTLEQLLSSRPFSTLANEIRAAIKRGDEHDGEWK